MFVEFIEETNNRKVLINVEKIDEVIDSGIGTSYTIFRQGPIMRPVLGSYQSTCDTLRAAGCKIIPLLEGEAVKPKGRKK